MTTPRTALRLLLLFILSLLVPFAPCAHAQQVTPQIPPSITNPPVISNVPPGSDPLMGQIDEEMAFERNLLRQKQIISQSAELLTLARKINAEVAGPKAHQPSDVVVKEAAEIEKLAKSIKNKMRDGY